jgi:penicillin amidase
MSQASVDSLINLQNDNYSILAENILATLTSLIDTKSLNSLEKEGFGIVSRWNKHFDANEIGASIFELWHKNLGVQIWQDEFDDPKAPMRYPSRDRSVELLLNEPNSIWFDNIKTPKKETRTDLVNASFKFAMDSLKRKYGPISKAWEWANLKSTHVPHLAKIAGFGSKKLYNGGSKTSVNAMSETNGPSWRMIVALGDNVKAYGVFPGGESGNPGSHYYDNMVDTWTDGKLHELVFLKSKNETSNRVISTWKLNKK